VEGEKRLASKKLKEVGEREFRTSAGILCAIRFEKEKKRGSSRKEPEGTEINGRAPWYALATPELTWTATLLFAWKKT